MSACRRRESNRICDEENPVSDVTNLTGEAAKWKNDLNNNLCPDESKSRTTERRRRRLEKQAAVTQEKPKTRPSYVPSYVRNVGFECNRSSGPPSWATQTKRSLSVAATSPRHRKANASRSRSTNGSDLPSRRSRLRSDSASQQSKKVHVRDAIAAMESRINSTPSARITRVARSKPVEAASRNKDPPPEVAECKKEHRRSMSESGDQQIDFKQMKEMWNQKTEQTKQLSLSDNAARSGGSSSSINSVGSAISVDRKVQNENVLKKSDATGVTFILPTRFTANRPPVIAPRPKNHRLRSRAVTVGQLSISDPPTESSTPSERSPSPTELLSVSEKVLLFGGNKRRSIPEDSSKRPEEETTETNRRRSSWSDDKQRIDNMNIEDSFMDDLPYCRIPKEGRIVDIFEKTRERRAKLEEEERLAGDLSKHARRAKERRRARPSTGSSTISSPSDDEERPRPELCIPGVRRRSKDSGASTPVEEPQIAIQKTESSIFGSASSIPESTENSRISVEEAEFRGRRRASSLQKLLENKFYDSALSTNTQSAAENSTIIDRVSEAVLPPVAECETCTSPVPRPNNLDLSDRKRSNTDDSDATIASNLSNNDQVSKSPEKIGVKLSPTTPDKRSSGFCEEEDSFCVKASSNQSPSKDNVTSDVKKEEFEKSSSLTSSVSSSLTQTPSLGGFNPLEEYDKIAKQLSEEEEQSPQRRIRRPISENSSTLSFDSGFRNSLEVPTSREVDSWSDFIENSSDEETCIPDTPSKQPLEILPSPTVSLKESNEVKLHNIAKELLSTEESYVAVLHLIDQVFHKQVLDAATQKNIMPKQVVDKIFSHVPAIYSFHSSFLLPQLKERLENWENNPRIGDIMTKAAPFLKMYSLYVQQFDETMNLIKQWSEKSNGFNSIIQAIQKTPECNFLTLQHHMLGPVQRVPRYRLLLKDYVKKLPEDAADRQEAETALSLITKAATHSNETMKKIEKFHKLVSIFNNLADIQFDFVDVTRELLKEGKIIKISARNGEKYERYLYLFSDMLLCCTPQRRLGNKAYKVTAKIDLDGMKVSPVQNNSIPFAFIVNGLQKSMEFATNVEDEREKWIQAIQDAIEERKDRQRTFRSFIEQSPADESLPLTLLPPVCPSPQPSPVQGGKPFPAIEMSEEELGTRAPRWIKDHETTACMCCSKHFNKLLRRRHHCRACGGVICSECSDNKTMLQYDMSKPMKVCTKCFYILNGRRRSTTVDGEKKSSVLEVGADTVSENSIVASYLYYCENLKKKHWVKTWCVIPKEELCLYFYGAHQDSRAQKTMPLPGFEITDMNCSDYRFVFRLTQAGKNHHFAGEDKFTVEKWKYAIGQASKGYDLNKDDVERLGRPVSSSSSEEIPDEEEEEGMEDQFEAALDTSLELRAEKFIDDDEDSEEQNQEEDELSPVEEESSEINFENDESDLSNDPAS